MHILHILHILHVLHILRILHILPILHILHILHIPTSGSLLPLGRVDIRATRAPLPTQTRRARPNWAPTSGNSRPGAPPSTLNGRCSTGGLPSTRWQDGAICAQKRSSTFSENQRWLLSTRGRRSATIVDTLPCLFSQMLGKWKYQDSSVVCIFDFVILCSFTCSLLMIEVLLMKLRVEK